MTAIHRREMLRVILGGAVASAGLALMPVPAGSAPLTVSKSRPATTDNLVEEAVVVVRRRRRVAPPPQGEGVLVAPGTSSLPLALGLKARPVGGFKPRPDSRKRHYGT